jgi:CelD/BcsL family acetyltransferase involved in cellulose biosynthesis
MLFLLQQTTDRPFASRLQREEYVILQPVTSQIRVSLIESWRAAPALPDAWQRLLERTAAGSVFQTLPWQTCWWRAFAADHELRVLLAWCGTRLIGVAPLMMRKECSALGRTRQCLHFIGSTNHASDYCDFIIDPEYPQALDALLSAACELPFDRIDLSHLPSKSANRERIAQLLRGAGLHISDDVQNEAPVRILGNTADDRKAANKTSLRRNKRYFEKQGTLRHERITATDDILRRLPAFFEQHRRRWDGTDWPSLFLAAEQRRFYRDIVRELAPTGALTFDVVWLDEEPLAFHLGFEFHGTFIWYKPTFDVRHAQKSPGQVLLKFLLEDAINRKLSEFDFTIGPEGFKHRFANEVRHIHRIVGFRSVADYWAYRSHQELRKRFGNGAS